MTILLTIFLIFIAFCSGYILAAILRTGKISEMWLAIELSAYKNDNRMCKELLEMKVDNE